jgi:hypothetical protein
MFQQNNAIFRERLFFLSEPLPLPEDGIVLPKHVEAIVRKNREIYNFSAFGWLTLLSR